MRLAYKLTVPLCACSILVMLMLVNFQFGVQPDSSGQSLIPSENSSSRRRFKSTREKDDGPDWAAKEQEMRRRRVQSVCDRNIKRLNSDIIPEKFKYILVDDTHHFLYCETPKVACTNWKRILLILSGKMNTTDPGEIPASKVHGEYSPHIRKLSSYTPEEIEHRIKKYYKYMFVRNPLERIVSAYYNKFTMKYNQYFPLKFGTKIVKRYRKKPTAKALLSGTDVQFTEFVQYLLDPSTTADTPFNAHWRQFYQICRPCMMNYDFIGKYEWIEEDAEHVLQQLGVSSLVKFPTSRTKKAKD